MFRERVDEELDLEIVDEVVQLDNIAEQNWLNEGQIIRNRYIYRKPLSIRYLLNKILQTNVL